MSSETPKKVTPFDLFKKNNRAFESVQEERLAICEACPELIQATHTCKECGCFMTAKVKLAQAYCPLHKWEAVAPSSYKE